MKGRRGTPKPIAATVVVLAACLVAAACGTDDRPALEDNSSRDQLGRITEAGDVGVLRLQPGDCFLAGENEIESVLAVPCANDHDSEVIAVFALGDIAWPGATAVETAARQGCLERFEAATGFAYDSSTVELTAYAPTSSSWSDDRSVICVALAPDGRLVRGGLTGAGA